MSATEVATEVSPKNKTLYVKAEDAEVWAKAEWFADQPISALVADLLRGYVARREQEEEARKTGIERVEVEISDQDQVRLVAFQGRKLTVHIDHSGGAMRGDWAIYLTSKGKFAVYREDSFGLSVYDSFEDLKQQFEEEAPDLLARVADALGRRYVQDLDI